MKHSFWHTVLIPPPRRKMWVCAAHNRLEWIATEALKQRLRLAHPTVQTADHEWSPMEVAALIEETRRRHKLSFREVSIGWPVFQGVWVRLLGMPEMPDEEVRSSIRWTMAEEADFTMEEASCTWTRIPAPEEGESFVVAYAVRTAAIKQWVAAMREWELEPVEIVLPACHYPVFLPEQKAEIYALLEFSDWYSYLYVFYRDVLCFVREVPIKLSQFEDSLMEVLISEKGKIELTREQAHLIRNECGVPMDQGPTSIDGLLKKHVMSLIRPLLETLVREISFSLDYFVAVTEQSAPQQLYLLSQDGRMRNLDLYLSEQLGMQVEYVTVPEAWRPKQEGEQTDPTRFRDIPYQVLSAAVGGPDRKIDLLPASLSRYYRRRLERVLLHVIMVTLPIFILVSHWLVRLQWEDYENRKRLAVIQDNNLDVFRSLNDKINTKNTTLNIVRQGYVPMNAFLRFLSAVTPDEVTLDVLNFDNAAGVVTLKGRARLRPHQQSVLPDYIARLEDSAFFDEVYLISSNNRGGLEEFVIRGELPEDL